MKTKERNELDSLTTKYNELVKQKEIQDEYLKYKNIALNDIWYNDILKEYNDICNEYNENIKKEKGVLFNKKEAEKRIDILTLRIKTISSLDYSSTVKSKSIDDSIMELNNKKVLFNKHPFLNKRKIKNVDSNILKYEQRRQKEKEEYDIKNKEELGQLDIELGVAMTMLHDSECDLEILYSDRERLENRLNELKREIKEKYNCDSIEDVETIIRFAKEYIEKNKIECDYSIDLKIKEVEDRKYEIEIEEKGRKR